MKLFSFIILLFVNFSIINGQSTPLKEKFFTEFGCHYGFVMPHHDYMSYFVNKHVQGFHLNIGLSADGEKKWHKYYNYPKYGIGYYHSGLGNSDIYGKVNALYFFYNRLYLNNNRKVNFGNRIAFGLGYITKKFDLYSNPFDMVIGSKLNVHINYSVECDIRTSLLHIKLGLGITHYSNGNFQEPNKGINLITSYVSLQYLLKKQVLPDIKKVYPDESYNKNQFIITGAYGWKNISRFHKYYYPVYALSAEYSKRITYTNSIGIALTGYIDRSMRKEHELGESDLTASFQTMDYLRLALNFSYELRMGNLAYLIQPGIYLKNSYKKPGIITNRMGLRYYWNQKWHASVMVKAHWLAIADVVEWGIGYRIGRNQ